MENLTAQYKRRVQRWLLLTGFLLSAALNADTIRAVHVLSTNDALRNTIAAYGVATASRTNYLEGTNLVAVPEPGGLTTLRSNLTASLQELNTLQQVGFPLGWQGDRQLNFTPYHELNSSFVFLLKLLGLLATAVAVSAGAPFWFDLLNKLVSLRRSVPGVTPTVKQTPAANVPVAEVFPAATPAAYNPEMMARPSVSELLKDLGEGRLGFDVRKAYWTAEASLLAYADSGTVRATVESQWSMRIIHFFDQVESVQAFLAVSAADEGPAFALLAFRGTEKKLEDWQTDASFSLTREPCVFPGTSTHTGFCTELEKVFPEIKQKIAAELKKETLLYVTGHSLGGALATLVAARLTVEKIHGVHSVYTFGAPRVGDVAFARAYDYVLGSRTYRCVNAEDLVTRVPPRTIPGRDWQYEHVGQVVYFDTDGRMQLNPAFWLRFLNTISNALVDFRAQLQRCLKDHSMEGYVRLLKSQLNFPGARPRGEVVLAAAPVVQAVSSPDRAG